MASKYDIGPKIGVEGEKEFRNSIQKINDSVKTLGTEMAAVTSAYAKNDKSAENLTKQNEILRKEIAEQSKKLEEQKKFVADHAEELEKDENAAEDWKRTINLSTAALNKMERQLRENNETLKNMDSLDDIFQDADNLADELGRMSDEAVKGGSSLNDLDSSAKKPAKSISALTVAMGNLIASGIQKVGSILGEAASAIANMDKTTEEYRIAQGKLNTAFETSGKSAESAKETYTEFYKILGDTGTAAEASQLLAKLADDEEDLSEWTKIAAGVYGTFGDALPINGLIEAANETVKTGKVTGVLADALNWAGISEDAFNASLEATADEGERNRMLMETLAGTYDEASSAFYRNNDAIVKSRENQAKLDEITGKLGETVSRVKNTLMEKFGPALADIGNKAAEFISNIDFGAISDGIDSVLAMIGPLWETIKAGFETALAAASAFIESIQPLLGAIWEGIKAGFETAYTAISAFMESIQPLIDSIANAFTAAWGAIKAVWDLVEPYFSERWEQIKAVFAVVEDVLGAYFSMAWDNIKIVWDTVVDYFSTIWDTISGIFSVVESVLSGDFQGAWDAIQGIFEEWSEFFTGLWDNVGEIFANVGEFFLDIGGDIVDGIKKGISDAWSNFKKWVSDKFNGLVGGVKDLLGIHSPSTVFAGIGGYMAEGLAVGFGNEMSDVQRRIDRSMASLIPDVPAPGVQPGGMASGGIGGNGSNSDLAAAFQAAMSGMAVYMSGRKVGSLVTLQQGRDQRAAGGFVLT